MDLNINLRCSYFILILFLKSPLSPSLKDKYCSGYGNIHGVYFSVHGNYNILRGHVQPILG